MMRIFFFIGVVMALLTSCNQEKEQREQLRDEVMDLHDEAMPMISDLRAVRKKLEARYRYLLPDSASLDSAALGRLQEYGRTFTATAGAEEAMMRWMRSFDPTIMEDGTPHEDVMTYLNKQKEHMESVKEYMETSLAGAEKALTFEGPESDATLPKEEEE